MDCGNTPALSRAARRVDRPACATTRGAGPAPTSRPADERLSAVDDQLHPRTDRQADLGRHVPERQACQDGRRRRRPHAREHRCQRVAAVERRLAIAAHRAEQHRLLRIENAGLLQLQEIALDPVRVLVDVLDEEDPALDARPVRRRQHRVDDREVAAPERAADVEAVEARTGAKADRLQRARHRLDEAFGRDVVDAAFGRAPAEVVAGERPGPGDAAAVREQAELERRHVAHADPARSRGDACADSLPLDPVEQASQPVAAATRQRHARLPRRDAVQRREPGVVVAGEALHPRRRRFVDRDVEAELAETRRGAAQRRDRAHDAGRREHDEAAGGLAHRPPARRHDAASPRSRPASSTAALGIDLERLAGRDRLEREVGVGDRQSPCRRGAAGTARDARRRTSAGCRARRRRGRRLREPCGGSAPRVPKTSITEPAAPAFGSRAP